MSCQTVTILTDYELLAEKITKRLPALGSTGAVTAKDYLVDQGNPGRAQDQQPQDDLRRGEKRGFPELEYFNRWKAPEVMA